MTSPEPKTPRPLSNVIGMPVKSCLKAETALGEAFVHYVRNAGFTHSREYMDLLDLTTISFTFTQNGLKRRITIPLLLIVPIPMLLIDSVIMKYTLNIDQDEQGKITGSIGNDTGNGWGYNSENRFSQQMKMSVRVGRYGVPAGVAKLLDLAANKGLHGKPFVPSEHRRYERDHVLGLCSILDSLKAKMNSELLGILDTLAAGASKWEERSPYLARYLQLRKLPIEQRAKMPYKTIIRDKHLIFTNCCNHADEVLMNFDVFNSSYKVPLYDYVDGEDLVSSKLTAESISSIVEVFGSSSFSSLGPDYIDEFEKILENHGFTIKSDIKLDGETFSYLLEGRNCIVDFYQPPVDENEDPFLVQRRKCQIALNHHYIYLPFNYSTLVANSRLVEDTIAARFRLLTKRYNARQCQVYDLSQDIADMFLNAYHPSATVKAPIHLGLGYEGKLVQMISVVKLNEHGDYEIARIACRHDCYVIGGASKLIGYFIKSHKCDVLYATVEQSYCALFNRLGFKITDSYEVGVNGSLSGLYKYKFEIGDKMLSSTPSQNVENVPQKSAMFLKYLELRKLPVEDRAKMDYKTIIRDKHFIFTDCCTLAPVSVSEPPAASEPEKSGIDLIDPEDEAMVGNISPNILNAIDTYGIDAIDLADEVNENMTSVLNGLNVRYSSGVTVNSLKFDYSTFSTYIDIIGDSTKEATKNIIEKKIRYTISAGKIYIPISKKTAAFYPRIVKDVLSAKVAHYLPQEFSANSCDVVEIESSDAKVFMNAYYANGYCEGNIHYGLVKDNKLLAVMSFKYLDKKGNVELVGGATRHMCRVICGASKLLEEARLKGKWNSVTVLAESMYSDVFKKLGFTQMESYPVGHNGSMSGLVKFKKTYVYLRSRTNSMLL